MKKLLLILLCLPMIGFGQSRKKMKQVISSQKEILKQDSLIIVSIKEKINLQNKKIQKLQNEIEILKKTDDNYYKEAIQLFNEKKYTESENIFNKIILNFPKSKLLSECKNKILEVNEKKEAKRIEIEKQEKLKSIEILNVEYDDISEVTTYKQPYFTHYANSNITSIYVRKWEGNKSLRLKMTYFGSSWIFFENAVLHYDGNTKKIEFDKYKQKRTDVVNGGVWESIDVSISNNPDMISFLRKFAKSKDAKQRLVGKYSQTRNLDEDEKKGIIDILNAYESL